MTDSLTLAKTCAAVANDIHAEDIVVLDMRKLITLTDYFVICTATSVPHLKAVARDMRHQTEAIVGELPRSTDGDANSLWMVIDYVDVIVHIFHSQLRDVYSLERLWADAPRIGLEFLPETAAGSV